MAVTQRRREVPVPLELAALAGIMTTATDRMRRFLQTPWQNLQPWSLASAGTCGKLLASGNRTTGQSLALETRQGEMLMQTSK